MSEPNDPGDRHPPEGVRIIGPEEAQAALDAGAAGGRRADDELGFGDVPPVPSGPRPPHRFPLPDSVDPAEAVPRPPVIPPRAEPPVVRTGAIAAGDLSTRFDEGVTLHRAGSEGRASSEDGAGREDGAARDGGPASSDPHAVTEEHPVVVLGAEAAPLTASPAGAPTPPPTVEVGEQPPAVADEQPVAPPAGQPSGDELPGDPSEPAWLRRARAPWPTASPPPSAGGALAEPSAGGGVAEPSAGEPSAAAADPPLWDLPTGPLPTAGPLGVPIAGAPGPGIAAGPGTHGGGAADPTVVVPWEAPAAAPPAGASAPPTAASSPEDLARSGSGAGGRAPEVGVTPMGPEAGSTPRPGLPGEVAARAGSPIISAPLADPTMPIVRPEADLAEAAAPDPSRPGDGAPRPGGTGALPPDDTALDVRAPEGDLADVAGLPRRRALGGRRSAIRNPNRRASRGAPRPAAVAPSDEAPRPLEEGAPVSSGFGTDMPHWTDPPTGEVPRTLAGRAGSDDDLAAWEALGGRTSTWRDDSTGWDHVDDGLDDLIDDDEVRLGALDSTRTEHSDLYSFDEDFERLEEERSGQHRIVAGLPDDDDAEYDDPEWAEPRPMRVGSRPQPMRATGARSRRRPPSDRDGGAGGERRGGSGGDIGSRVVVGAALVAALAVATAVGPVLLLLLALVVITAAAAEAYDLVRPSGFKPATLLGLAATVGVVLAAYWRGPDALPLLTVLVFAGSMCWYLFKVVEAPPLANAAVSTATFVWVGLLGSYAALLLRQHGGRSLFLGAVIPVVVADIVAYFAGRSLGSRPLAPSISPSKTWEGAIGGGVGAVVSGVVVGASLSAWGGVRHGLVLGLAVAVLAPIGDLFESMVKRDLAVKDSGKALSAHGGVLDRFDSLLVVLPAAYYLATWWHLAA